MMLIQMLLLISPRSALPSCLCILSQCVPLTQSLTDSKKISLKPDPFGGGKGLGAGIVPLGHPELLANRPVNALALISATVGEPLVLAAYGPVGAQLGTAELLKVCRHTLQTFLNSCHIHL